MNDSASRDLASLEMHRKIKCVYMRSKSARLTEITVELAQIDDEETPL